MRYGTIKKADIANGVGVRVSLFVSGCRHHCKGCFQPETWDFNYGDEFTSAQEDMILSELERPYYNGLTILGGEPMEPENQSAVLNLVKRFKEKFPHMDLWVYSGYLFEDDILAGKLGDEKITRELISYVDVLVDGKFVEAEKDITLKFRGSRNQRLIDVKKSLEQGKTVLLELKNSRM